MFGKAITYKTTTKCLADNRTAKYEASVASSTTKTGLHDIAEILLKVVLKTKHRSINQSF
jgi:hypothetical protein